MVLKDQLNRPLVFSTTPRRIISLVPSLTELLCDLGLKSELVGITKFCVHPKELMKEVDIVGGTKSIKRDKIISLKPDIIIANKEENTKDIIKELKGIAPIYISDINTVDDCFRLIYDLGKIFNKIQYSESLIRKIEVGLSEIDQSKNIGPRPVVAYFIWKDPWMVAASDTFINHILEVNGYQNYFQNQIRYPEIELDDLKGEKLDYIFLSSEPFPFKEKHLKLLKEKFPTTEVLIVDGELFSWYGSRLLLAFNYFKTLNKRLNKLSQS